ncbi:hypothetical protein HUO09_18910 [Vibrio sp. Y2-5]|uniref:hypothetical protein n=1 Tax=Vibrio sp. Y2-5 TaxID=2743977 RepID=UPI001660CEFC|nr:hypothetical protein [Vibrio sp. Y2-5]MBD0788433.1 hypothetical protein [Vibrio sp. Y2-5]
MHPQTHFRILQTMRSYTKKGKKSIYKKKQIKRLVTVLNDIFKNEGSEKLEAIGRRQIIGYWRRNTDSDKVRYEKYLIIRLFFEVFNSKISVPKPKSTTNSN